MTSSGTKTSPTSAAATASAFKKSRFAGLRRGAAAVSAVLAESPLLTGLAATAVLLVILFFVGLSIIAPHSAGQQTTLTNATELISHGQATRATLLDVDAQLELRTNNGQAVWATYPHSDSYTGTLIALLQSKHVPTSVNPQSGKEILRATVQFLLPILILVTLFAFFMTLVREQGAAFASFSKWSGSEQKAGEGRTTFADVAGAPEALIELGEVCDYLENPGRYANLGAKAPKGVILTGPPGTGKTLLARAVAGEAQANFFSLSGSEFVESLVGVGAARVRDLFRQAREAAPAIIFIDELDAIGRQRGAGMGQGNDEREQTLNQILVEMDGFGAESGIVIMAATNRPDILDNALLRPGRFDRQVVVDVPDVHGRTEILELHAGRSPISPQADLVRIAHQTPGFTGADLANIINEAALLTVRAGKQLIEQEELEEAIDRVMSGPARKSHVLSRDEVWRIAVHESGHAVVARAIGNSAALQKLSVVARARGRGGATVYSSEDKLMLTHLDLAKNLITTMAGVAAEDYVFGMLSTGGENDLDEATNTAHAMVSVWGMSEAIGPVTVGEKPGEIFIARDLAKTANIAAATHELVDSETRRLTHEAEDTAKQIIEINRTILEELANTLLDAETLSGPALDAFLEAVLPWQQPLVKGVNGHVPPVVLREAVGVGDIDGSSMGADDID
ncbi:MAG TPA: ATP-dependent zinc metalloprotease FtsH [Solirubrobacteraceae bacterium]|jgi:cell division protease FtsH|nr:ATP-dependent zinc metalloprotease FtsH [Solirubrobacteraceae bacterium]